MVRHTDQTLEEHAAGRPAAGADAAQRGRTGWFAAGGVVTALLASSCCVLPLVLVTMGIGGVWLGKLTALAAYKPWFLGATALLLAAGFWHVYRRPKKACADGSYCARPAASRITKSVLWFATLLALASASVDLWAPLFY